MGVSSSRIDNITTVNKSIFTSCKKTDNCPPWSIQANKIIHDKDKKQINYKNAKKFMIYQFYIFLNFFIQIQL